MDRKRVLMPSRKPQVTSKASGRKIYVRIQEDIGTSDSQGGHVPNYVDVPGLSHVPATARTMNAFQQYHYQELYAGATVRLFIRYRASTASITPAMRAVWGNHIYMIEGAENYDQDNDTVVLYCSELQAAGSERS
jgi:head-tail adaptor